MSARQFARPGIGRLAGRRGAAVAGLVALGLAATACGGDSKDKDDKTGGASAPATAGGTMTMLAVQDSASLDPFRTSYVAVADEPRMAALYDPLFYIDPKTGKVTPHLGESLSTADNGTTWTMKLRAGVQFSDGTPLDAAAVKQNYDMHANLATQSVHAGTAMQFETAVVDASTLTLKPKGGPNPALDRAIASELTYVEAPSALNQGPEVYGSKPIGAGPFVLKDWKRGSQQEFAKNPNYWQKDKGLPKLDGFTVKNVPDIQQQYTSVKSGQADIFVSSDPKLLKQAKNELNVSEFKTDGGQMVQFNMAKPPFNDPRARRAIALAIDPKEIDKTLQNGYVPAGGYFNSSGPFVDPAVKQPAPDQAEAQKLFNDLAAEGKKVDFSFLVPQNPSSVKVAEFIQSRLRTYQNVNMSIESLEIGAYIQKYAIKREFTAMLFQQWVVDPEPTVFNSLYSTSFLNFIGWKNADADKALVAGRMSTDPAVRKQAYSDLQKAMVADLPIWVYAESSNGPIFSNKITGIEQYNAGVFFMDRIGRK